jgi:quaternary ammonium compound-resistance protein SugE
MLDLPLMTTRMCLSYCRIFTIQVQRKEVFVAWLLLFSAGLAEIIFALSLKYNQGFTKLGPSIITMLSGVTSFYLLMMAIKTLPLGTAYAVWTGMGAIGVAVLGIILFKDSADWYRLLSLALVIAGIIGLKLTDSA